MQNIQTRQMEQAVASNYPSPFKSPILIKPLASDLDPASNSTTPPNIRAIYPSGE